MVNTILKEADLFCPNSVRINFTIYLLIIFPGNIIGGAILYAVTALVMTDPTQGDHSDDGDSVIKGEFREK
ncbi:hypothetical protein GBO85_09420 [Pediococcus acidilactici]|uniref:hypothetical protein n=1 Tax=Pediococcus acidilactici TaxID=1254 RepID=UPI0013228615|nr:hypothetical protein [Pediococcus acidilactici]KAF0333457.1 hypothetical protein GBO20_09475 [Pediococcus acidilactici]KAF0337392.1 hypothetical protein GBO40_10180 [Pediococcus acidilactici]KAF0377934.1 hypothetical protein GBO63_09625 [Pediococcus acidilactici]KAF0387543.1 hypothetical protein GBO66_10010 [Pediococcus acidilactici]KAF0411957.1 hypothetical protein GBO77_10210 [Pediococcus acidilactici]